LRHFLSSVSVLGYLVNDLSENLFLLCPHIHNEGVPFLDDFMPYIIKVKGHFSKVVEVDPLFGPSTIETDVLLVDLAQILPERMEII